MKALPLFSSENKLEYRLRLIYNIITKTLGSDKVKIGISVKMRKGGFDRFDSEKYNKIKSFGFDCVDFDMCNTDNQLYSLSDKDFEAYLNNEKELAQKAGVEIHQTHGPWRWPVNDGESELAERMEKMEKSIRATSLLGCKYWVIHPVMPYGIEDVKIGNQAETWAMNLAFMKELLQTAKEYGVTVCVENTPFPNFSLATPQQILKLVEEINDDNFKICLDTGHVAVFSDLSVGDEVRQLADKIKVFHVHDNGGKKDEHLPPHEGVIAWQDFSAALKEIGFDGVLSLEIVPKESLPTDEFERQSIALAQIAHSLLLAPSDEGAVKTCF